MRVATVAQAVYVPVPCEDKTTTTPSSTRWTLVAVLITLSFLALVVVTVGGMHLLDRRVGVRVVLGDKRH